VASRVWLLTPPWAERDDDMKKMVIAVLLALCSTALAEQCYFQTRRTSYDSGTSVKKISCKTAKKAVQDIRFYSNQNMDNYARYYAEAFGQEGNIIVEDNGSTTIMKFYYALGEFRYYGGITYRGANVSNCGTTTSTGYCDNFEYTDFGNYLRDFLSSAARKKKR
jgi:hypothetical protein